MENKTDLELLRSGEKNLINSDFSYTRLVGLDLSGRNFAGANFTGANLTRANLRGAHLWHARLIGTNLRQAILDDCVADSAIIIGAHLNECSLLKASFKGAAIEASFLVGANLRGADFSHASFIQGNDFTGARVDSITRFDGARVPVGIVSDPVFRHYRLEGMHLVRKSDEETAGPISAEARDVSRSEVLQMLSDARQTLALIAREQSMPEPEPVGLMGHNNPPPDAALSLDEVAVLESALGELSIEVENKSEAQNPEKVATAKAIIGNLGKKISDWLVKNGNLFFEELSKAAGAAAGKAAVGTVKIYVLYRMFSHQLDTLIPAISSYLQ